MLPLVCFRILQFTFATLQFVHSWNLKNEADYNKTAMGVNFLERF